MVANNIISVFTKAEQHGACGGAYSPLLTTNHHHRPVTVTSLCWTTSTTSLHALSTDNIPGHVLKDLSEELKGVLIDIFNTGLLFPCASKKPPPCISILLHWLPHCCTYILHYEVLWKAGDAANQIHPPSLLGPVSVCLSSHRGCNLLCSLPSPHPPGHKGLISENAVHRLQLSTQHHHPSAACLEIWASSPLSAIGC